MTEKLYYQDQFTRIFSADALSLKEADGGWLVELDRTAFYPEGGGQPADRGTIGGLRVIDVSQEGEKIFHLLEGCPEERQNLECRLDWERRFDHMQQHTGQHLLSAVFSRDYRADTIGFHLGEEYVSIDLDREVDKEDLDKVEEIVNEYIYQDLEVEAVFPDAPRLAGFKLRKDPTVQENIRIVKIGEIDYSPCGGTHLARTGELGMVKIINSSSYKGGIRVEFLCGGRALRDYRLKNGLISRLRGILSIGSELIPEEVERLQAELKEREQQLNELEKQLLDRRADEMLSSAVSTDGIRIVSGIFEEDFKKLKYLAGQVTGHGNAVVVFGQKEKETARLMAARSEDLAGLDMGEIIKRPLDLIAGRGGGNKLQAQGGGSNPAGLTEAVEEVCKEIKKKMLTVNLNNNRG